MKQAVVFGMVGALLAGWLSNPFPILPNGPAQHAAPPSHVLEARATPTVPADTLRRRVQAGQPLIMTLPAMLDDRPVASYRFLRAPALSWLVDRSILWRTRSEDVGDHAMLVGVALADAPPDTLTILVTVTE